jgi:hypothetical protein
VRSAYGQRRLFCSYFPILIVGLRFSLVIIEVYIEQAK